MPRIAPCGTWTSSLSAADVAGGGLRLGGVSLDGDDIHWLEARPREGGRYALVRRTPDGGISEATPQGINVRSRVHKYGGAAYIVARGTICCVNFADQRVYRIAASAEVGGSTEQDPFYRIESGADHPCRHVALRRLRNRYPSPASDLCARRPHAGRPRAAAKDRRAPNTTTGRPAPALCSLRAQTSIRHRD